MRDSEAKLETMNYDQWQNQMKLKATLHLITLIALPLCNTLISFTTLIRNDVKNHTDITVNIKDRNYPVDRLKCNAYDGVLWDI